MGKLEYPTIPFVQFVTEWPAPNTKLHIVNEKSASFFELWFIEVIFYMTISISSFLSYYDYHKRNKKEHSEKRCSINCYQ